VEYFDLVVDDRIRNLHIIDDDDVAADNHEADVAADTQEASAVPSEHEASAAADELGSAKEAPSPSFDDPEVQQAHQEILRLLESVPPEFAEMGSLELREALCSSHRVNDPEDRSGWLFLFSVVLRALAESRHVEDLLLSEMPADELRYRTMPGVKHLGLLERLQRLEEGIRKDIERTTALLERRRAARIWGRVAGN
jgi:hypothetical protein